MNVFMDKAMIAKVLLIIKQSKDNVTDSVRELATIFFLNFSYNNYILSPLQKEKVSECGCKIKYTSSNEFVFTFDDNVVVQFKADLPYADNTITSPLTPEEASQLVADLINKAKY